jgi:hypothetical protein
MPRPNPVQYPGDDAVILRRELKQLLPSDIALDQVELYELLDLSNVGGRYDVLRLKLLRRAISSMSPTEMLSTNQFSELLAYRDGRGPRPQFARYVTPDGHFIGASIAGAAGLSASARDPGPVEDPSEPGRYVQPKGRFARGDEEAFRPDTR